jgi:hypothetical protein
VWDAVADLERSRTYAAETRAFEGTLAESPLTFAEIVDIVSSVTATTWWARYASGPVLLKRGAQSRIHSQACSATGTVVISEVQQTPATVAHELAHLCRGSGHDSRFRGAELALICAICGPTAAEILRTEFAAESLGFDAFDSLSDWPSGLLARHPRFA